MASNSDVFEKFSKPSSSAFPARVDKFVLFTLLFVCPSNEGSSTLQLATTTKPRLIISTSKLFPVNDLIFVVSLRRIPVIG